MTSHSFCDDGYSQDSDFDSDTLVSYATNNSNEPNDFETSQSPSSKQSCSPQYQLLGENNQHYENEPVTKKFIIRQDKSNERNSPAPNHLSIATTYSLSRLKELSNPRSQFHHLPLPPQKQERKRSTRNSYMDFLERQESLEQSRQTKLMRKKMELEYEAKVTKLKCPRCSNEQSFHEANSGRTTCKIDGETYVATTFSMKSFEKRMFRSSCKKQQTLEEIRQERTRTLQKAKKKATLRSREGDFLKRMLDDLDKRKENLHRLRLSSKNDGFTYGCG
jgi:ribosomal protein S27E